MQGTTTGNHFSLPRCKRTGSLARKLAQKAARSVVPLATKHNLVVTCALDNTVFPRRLVVWLPVLVQAVGIRKRRVARIVTRVVENVKGCAVKVNKDVVLGEHFPYIVGPVTARAHPTNLIHEWIELEDVVVLSFGVHTGQVSTHGLAKRLRVVEGHDIDIVCARIPVLVTLKAVVPLNGEEKSERIRRSTSSGPISTTKQQQRD